MPLMLPTCQVLSNAFRPRGTEPGVVPHCYTQVRGSDLTKRHRDMMSDPVEPNAVYCCLKAYARDLHLSQPPVLVSRPCNHTWIQSRSPAGVHPLSPLTDRQIQMYTKLHQLCSTKFELPRAAEALQGLIFERRCQVFPTSWLHGAPRQFGVFGEGHAYFPYLPSKCWNLVAKVASTRNKGQP